MKQIPKRGINAGPTIQIRVMGAKGERIERKAITKYWVELTFYSPGLSDIADPIPQSNFIQNWISNCVLSTAIYP